MLDKTKFDPNAPAFGASAQKLEDLINDAHAQSSVEEPQEVREEVSDDIDTSVEENKVPYSRFKKFHDKALEAEQEAEKWRQRAEELENSRARSNTNDTNEMPSYWKELYGDSEVSQRAWQIQEQREQDIERRAYEAGQRGAEELEHKQQQRIEGNVATIDDNFDNLSDYVGRELTAKEQSAILDIVDDFTPKDEYGRYAGPLIPFEKAWEMYELKNNSTKTATRQSRDTVASISGAQSSGNTDIQTEKDKGWNPLARGTWRNRL